MGLCAIKYITGIAGATTSARFRITRNKSSFFIRI
jgi:hypothetical protein